MNTHTTAPATPDVDYRPAVDFDAHREQVAADLAADAADPDTGW